MYYTIYKITNQINGKIYIGMHQTNDLDDAYMGSGKHLKHSINKYGLENFTKEILHVFDNALDMKNKEAELVNEEFVSRKDTYNICEGGKGGFGHINTNEIFRISKNKKAYNSMKNRILDKYGVEHYSQTNECREKIKNTVLEKYGVEYYAQSDDFKFKMQKYHKNNVGTFTGKKHTEEAKEKMRIAKKGKFKGENNSQYGTMWITNDVDNKKISKTENIPDGWKKGRK